MLLKPREPLEVEIEQEKSLLNAGEKPPARIKNRLQRTAAKLLTGFFALMLVFTLVSRASDGITVARAKTDTIKSGIITNRISMDGVIKPIEDMNITLPGDIYVPNIKVGVGQRVKKGDVLLEFDDDDVKQQLSKLRDSLVITQLRLNAAENGVSSGDSSGVLYSKQALEQAQTDYERLKTRLDRSRQKAEDDLLAAEKELESALNDIPEGDENNITSNRLALEQAQTDYERLKEKLDKNKQRAEDDLFVAEKALTEARSAYSKAVEKAKADLIKIAEDKVSAAQTALASTNESANEAISNAQYAYDVAAEKESANEQAYYDTLNDVYLAEYKLSEANQELYWLLIAPEPNETIAAASSKVQAAQNDLDAVNKKLANMSLGESLDFKRARENLTAAREKWANKIREAENALTDAWSELSTIKAKTNMTDQPTVISAQAAVDSAQKAVNSAQRTLEDTKQTNADQLLSAERTIETAQRNLNLATDSAQKAVNSTQKAAIESAQKALDNAKKAFDDNKQTAEDQLLSSERAIESARKNLEQAQKQADDTAKTDDKSRKQAEIEIITYLAEKQALEKSIALLEEIIDMDGKLVSPIDGTIQSITNTGKTQDKIPVAVISYNDLGFFFETKIDQKSAEKLIVGDKGVLNYTSEGKNNEVEAIITSIGSPDENGKVPVTASLPVKAYPSGVSANVTVTRNSERQDACLPLSALRSNSNEDYVLVLRENKTVIGIEYTVTAVPVTVLARDSEQMSVNSSLTRDDRVIISTNKPVSEGDQVRYEKD